MEIRAKADAIITADWHLRENVPTCRTDDFWAAQWRKVAFVSKLQKEHSCPVLHAGDLFHHWKPSPYLLSVAMRMLPQDFFTVYGNHDLPQRTYDRHEYSGVHTLGCAERIGILNGLHWGSQLPEDLGAVLLNIGGRLVLVWHVMTWAIKEQYVGVADPSARQLLRKCQCDLVITGHHHRTFVVGSHNKLLVNPGPLTRQAAPCIDFKPSVFLWFAGSNTVQQVFIPIDDGIVTKEHIELVRQRDERINEFVASLPALNSQELDIISCVEQYCADCNVDPAVVKIIMEAFEEG